MKKYDNKSTQNINAQKLKEVNNAETQIAVHLIKLLDTQVQLVDQNIANRLTTARNLAVTQLSEREYLLAHSYTMTQTGNTLQWSTGNLSHYFREHRFMMIGLIGMAILFAFLAAQQFNFNNLERSDAFLLASDLPPEAFVDQGFDAWLDTKN